MKPDLTALDEVTSFAYPVFQGTSAAAPHVGGAAALLLSQARRDGDELKVEELREFLRRWAVDMGEPGPDPVYGEGKLRLFVEQARAQRAIHVPEEGVVVPGEPVTVELSVRMPSTQVGGMVLRETLPDGLVGRVDKDGGADGVEEGSELVLRWDLLLPGEERLVRYTVAVPEDWPPGSYEIAGTLNHDPVGGDALLRVATPDPVKEITVVCAPNPAQVGEGARFTVHGVQAREVRLRVHDLAGRLVYDSGWQPGPSYPWNLQDDQGRVVAGGVYLYWVEVRAGEGHTVRTEVERLLVLR